jgi:stage II sporulation protein GA (sporulation sigma-E factor processing peptidase)
VVYLDVLLFVNFIANTFLLYITCQTVRVKVKTRLLIISALFGTSYVLTMLFPSLSLFVKLPFQLIMAFLMVFIVHHKKNIMFVLKSTGLFILYSMLLSGFCVFLEYKFTMNSLFFSPRRDFDYRWLLVPVMILYIVVHRFIVFIQDRRDMVLYTYTVEIVTRDFSKTVRAFLDTGNELREPVTNLPVMIVERSILSKLTLRDEEKLYIPYRVVNGSGGKLEGFKPQFIRVYYESSRFELRDVIIALCDNKLNELDDYEALLSRGIV